MFERFKFGLRPAKRGSLVGEACVEEMLGTWFNNKDNTTGSTGSARGHALEPRTLLVYFFPRPRSPCSRFLGKRVGLKALEPSTLLDWLF